MNDAFDLFWSSYPRRQAKKDARKAWTKLRPDENLIKLMLAAIEMQKRSRQWRDGYIPLPATWIRGERYFDEMDAQPVQAWQCPHTPTCPSGTRPLECQHRTVFGEQRWRELYPQLGARL